ncbi:MAG TPA: KamA family radical SAM protein [Spirochaetia bacterium]|nr:KamA family radical SAM protein [Spirochaetia bacterium]
MEEQILSQDDSEPPGSHGDAVAQCKNKKNSKKTDFFTSSKKVTGIFPELINGRLRIPPPPTHTSSPTVKAFRDAFYPEATDAEWHNWRWQLRHRIRTLPELARLTTLSADELVAFSFDGRALPLSITPYYASLLGQEANPDQALRKAMIPLFYEHLRAPEEEDDPLGEDHDTAVPGLVHRYPDRVLFLVTDFCSVNCRYCTRSRMLVPNEKYPFNMRQWEQAVAYIRAHAEVRDVLLSGGDPLTLADEKIEWLLRELRSIPHVEFIRIGTKVPMVLPMRVTKSLCNMLRKYHPLWISIHATHPDELTPEARDACCRLADAGIPLGSQTVLLSGINDRVETMRALMHALLTVRVRPYYLYQCDPISGSAHFRTSVAKGLEIIKGLRGFTTGYAVPHFVIDAPKGGGKIPLLPEYVEGWDEQGNLILRNYEGQRYSYPDRAEADVFQAVDA